MNLCECGCGQPAPLAKRTSTRDGWIKGQPHRFINGHNVTRTTSKGNTKRNSTGYLMIKLPEHPFKTKAGYILYHRHILEQFLGYYLNPKEYHVHHIDFNKTNNDVSNLIAIRHSAHNRLHAMKQAKEGTLGRRKKP